MSVDGLASRRAALAAVRAVLDDGAWSNLAVPDAIAGLADARDRSFAAHLAYETVRWSVPLDAALAQVTARPLDDVEGGLLAILRLGALQLLRPGGVAPHAAIDTSVRLARESVPQRRAQGAGGFVNGVLRAVQRAGPVLLAPPDPTDPAIVLGADTAHPRWVAADLLTRLDAARVRAVLDADNRPPGVTLRAVGDPAALVRELRAAGLDPRPGRHLPSAVRVPGADPGRLPAVAEGRATVQDEASQVVAAATGAEPGMRVLDLCAGPGGKTADLAARVDAAGGAGSVVAVEQHPHRARLVQDSAARLGQPVTVHVGDATHPDVLGAAAAGAPFDVVLVDAPCTGLGTGRRRPEIRWRRTAADARALALVQQRLLTAAADHLAPGGRLTYSVCTWTGTETVEVAAAFAAAHPDLVTVGERQLLPDVDETDGMYVRTWRR